MLESLNIIDGSDAKSSSRNNERQRLLKKKTRSQSPDYHTSPPHHSQSNGYAKLSNWLRYHSPSYYFWRKYYFAKTNSAHLALEDDEIDEKEQVVSYKTNPFYPAHFAKGYQFTMEYLWPISLGLLLTHDLFVYALYPYERFDTTLEDIFLAKASNEVSWTKMGSDLIHEPSFWYPSILLVTLPVLLGVAEPFYRKLMGQYLIRTDWTRSLTQDGINDLTKNIAIHSKLSFLREKETLQRMEWGFFWEKELTAENKKAILDFFVSTSAYGQLSQVAAAFSEDNLGRYIKQNYLSSEESKLFRELQQSADEALQSRERDIKFNAKETIKKIFTAYGISASIYYLTLLVRKAIAISQYFHDKQNCFEPSVWSYIAAQGNYDCTVCGDWPFVYLGDINSPQGCLDGLIASGKNITHDDIARLSSYTISKLDLSSIPISQWRDDYFQAVFKQFEALLSVETVNLSYRGLASRFSNSKATTLQDYLRQLNVKALDISNQNLGANATRIILDGLDTEYQLDSLNLANNAMGDRGAQLIQSFISNHNISSLDISFNQFSPDGVSSIGQSLNNHNLKELYLRGVNIDQEAFNQITNHVTQSTVKVFDMSDSDLTGIDTSSLGESIPGSDLKALNIDNTYLSDEQLFALSKRLGHSSLEQISVADNFISDAGAIPFFWNLKGSHVFAINLAGNPLTDSFLQNTQSVIQMLPLRTLNLSYRDGSYCQFSSQALRDFITSLPTSLKSLNLANTTLDDAGFQALIGLQINGTYSIEYLDVSFTFVTDASKQPLYNLLQQNTPLLQLKLKGTYLTDSSIEMLVPAIEHNTNLKMFDVSSTYFTSRGAVQLAKAVTNHKQVLSLTMDNVPVTDESVYAITLIQGEHVDQTLLTSDQLSLDQRRALSHAKPSTDLQYISLQNCNLTTKAAQYLCRMLPYSDSSPDKLNLGGNFIDALEIDLSNCVASSASKNEPWLSLNPLRRLGESVCQSLHGWFKSKNNQTGRPLLGNDSTETYLSCLPKFMQQQTLSTRTFPLSSSGLNEFSSGSQLPSSAQALTGVMAMLCLFTYFFKKTNYSKIPLNDHYLSMVNASFKSLTQLEEIIKIQSQGRLGQSRLFFDRFEYANQKIIKIRNALETILKRQHISSGSLQGVQEDLQQLQKIISKNKQTNKTLRKIQIKEDRRERRNHVTGKLDVSMITRCTLTGELQHHFDPIPGKEESITQMQPSFVNSASNFFSSISLRNMFDFETTDQFKLSL